MAEHSGYPSLVSQEKSFFWSYYKSFIDQACSMKMTVYWPHLFVHSYGPKLSHLGLFQWMLNITLHYAAISGKVVGKNVHATIPKGNMGYDQHTVPDNSSHCSCRKYFCCFPLVLQTYVHELSLVPFFHISLKNSELRTTHNTFRHCRVNFFRQPFSK